MGRFSSIKDAARRTRQRKPATARALMEELEPRLLMSADAGVLGTTAALQAAEVDAASPLLAGDLTQHTPAPAVQTQRRELIIIDAATPDHERLLADLGTEAADGTVREVVLLRPDQDGVEQISDILSRYENLSAIHLISHGADGEIFLGSGALDLDSVLANARAIQGWGQALTADADLLIYGCNVAADDVGQTLIDTLGRLTGADVAASTDVTGSPILEADWDLEYAVGNVETTLAVSASLAQNWVGVLAAPVAVNDAYSVNEDSTLVVAPSTGNLSHWWQFDEGGSSQTTADSGSLANNGTLGSTAGVDAADPAWTTGYVGGGALSFDGAGDYVGTTSTDLKTASNFTLSAWFQTDTTTGAHHILWAGYAGGNGYGSGGSSSPATSEMSLSIGSYTAAYDNKIVFFLGYDVPANGADSIFIASASDFTDTGGWHHVAVSVTDIGGGVMSASLYVDGQLQGTDTGSQNDRSIWGGLRIGAPGDGSRSFDGKIDELRVYSDALSGAQIVSITEAGVLTNDSDVDSAPIKVNTSVVTGPANGTLSINADGSFTYTPNLDFSGTDTFTYRANDGLLDSNVATVTITVNPVNDAPVLAAIEGAALSYTENQAPTVVSSTITVSDADNAGPASVTVQITGNYQNGQDVLSFTNTASITGFWNAVSGTLTLTGSDTLANYQAALRAVRYANTSEDPSTLTRTVTFTVDDGTVSSNTVTRDITVTAANDPPVITTTGSALAYTENASATAIDAGLTVGDVDSVNLTGATVTISANYANGEDVLAFTNQLGITGSWDSATGTLTLTGTTTVANYQTALRAVTYVNSSDSPSTLARTVAFLVNDGADDSATATRNIAVTAVNDAPVLAAIEGTGLAYTENQMATAITGTITLSDADNATINSATVQITGNYVNGEDVLSFANTAGITGSWNAASGTLTLSGADTVANYQAALRAVKYANTSDNPGTLARTVSFTANDGTVNSNTVTRNITITAVNDAPVITSATLTVNEGQTVTLAPANFGITDPDDAVFTYTVSGISGGYFQLSSAAGVPITSFTSADLSGGLVQFVDDGNEIAPAFSVTVNDGALDSNTLAATVTYTPVNDAPVISSATLTVNEGQTVTLAPVNFGITDPDSAAFTYTVSGVSGGYFQLSTAAGVPITTFTSADLGSGLVQFVDDGNEVAPAFSVTVNDGALDSNTLAATITYNPVNDSPVVTSTGLTVSEGQTVTLAPVNFGITDPDSATFTYTVSGISGGYFQLSSAAGVPITVFTSADLAGGLVQFVDDGNEVAPAFSVTVNDGALDSNTLAATVTYTPVNDAPVITSATLTVNESQTVTLAPVNFGITDPDSAAFTYTVSGVSGGYFQLSSAAGVPIAIFTSADLAGGLVQFVDDGNEVAPAFSVTVNDGALDSNTLAATITYSPVNGPPAITSNGAGDAASVAVSEGGTAVTIVAAADADLPAQTLVYSIFGGADAALFTIDSATGVLSFVAAPDYEAPADADGDNVYLVTVQVSDGAGGTDGQDIAVTVINVNEAGVGAISDSDVAVDAVAENVAPGTVVGVAALAVDPDGPDTVSYSLDDDAGGRFAIDGASGVVTVVGAIDREAAASYAVTVRATSSDGSFSTRSFSIAINDVNEFSVTAPVDSNAATDAVAENATVGTVVGVAALASDADATGNAVTYSLDDDAGGRFAIDSVTGMVTVAGTLDYATASSHAIIVRATSADSSAATATFTVQVTSAGTPGVSLDLLPPELPPDPVQEDDPPADKHPEGTGPPTGDPDGQSGDPDPGGPIDILPGMVDRVVYVVGEVGQLVLGDGGTSDARRIDPGAKPKFFYSSLALIRGLLSMDPLGLPQLDTAGLWRALDSMGRDMSRLDAANIRGGLLVQVASGTTVMMSIGFVNWILRGGSLASAVLASMPLWRGIDPLPVLLAARRRTDEDEEQAVTPPAEDAELDRLFADMRGRKSPKGRPAGRDETRA